MTSLLYSTTVIIIIGIFAVLLCISYIIIALYKKGNKDMHDNRPTVSSNVIFPYPEDEEINKNFDTQYEDAEINDDLGYETNYDNLDLSDEEIKQIHKKNKITAREQVKEWEDLGLCAPGDAIGSAAWRCRKYKNCHDCLLNYASKNKEYTSFITILDEVSNQHPTGVEDLWM